MIDALTDRPMASVVRSLPFPQAMRDALIDHTGPGRLLDCVAAMEVGEFRRARRLVPSAPEHYLEALAWTNETARHLVGGRRARLTVSARSAPRSPCRAPAASAAADARPGSSASPRRR